MKIVFYYKKTNEPVPQTEEVLTIDNSGTIRKLVEDIFGRWDYEETDDYYIKIE